MDGTLGGAGHASEVAKRLSEKGRLIGIDQDADAIRAAGERLKPFGDKVTIIRSNYANMKEELHAIGIEHVDGIVLDLGVSSFQLDTPERDLPTGTPMRRLICAWMTDRVSRQGILSMTTARWISIGSSAITVKINLQKYCKTYSERETEEADYDGGRTVGNYSGVHPDESAEDRRKSGKAYVSGNQN